MYQTFDWKFTFLGSFGKYLNVCRREGNLSVTTVVSMTYGKQLLCNSSSETNSESYRPMKQKERQPTDVFCTPTSL